MRPVTFACADALPLAPEAIAHQILDLALWPTFRGYGPIPGIARAEFETRTPDVVGTRIRVTESNGGTHVETLTEWDPGRRVVVVMDDFPPPLSRLATRFVETWEFEARDGGVTHVVRRFALHPRTAWTRPPLALIGLLLRRAIDRHLHQMRQPPAPPGNPGSDLAS